MPTYFFAAYEVDSSYYFTDAQSPILSQDVLTITDSTDDNLHRTVEEDPANDQFFDFANETDVTDYTVQYLDFAQLNGSGPEYELYAMQVSFEDGSTKYYVMSKDENFNPNVGDDLAVTSFSNFTVTDYGQIGAAVCYAAGIRIQTNRGNIPVETIRKGDKVQTKDDGYREVLWVSARHLGLKELRSFESIQPILIKPHAIGNKNPLLVSPQHRLLVSMKILGLELPDDESFIKAKLLAEYFPRRARVARGKRAVSYHHFLLSEHSVVFADGAESESFYPGPMALKGICREDRRKISPFLALSHRDRPKGDAYGFKLSRPELKRKHIIESIRSTKKSKARIGL